jgi:hypothetical protein
MTAGGGSTDRSTSGWQYFLPSFWATVMNFLLVPELRLQKLVLGVIVGVLAVAPSVAAESSRSTEKAIATQASDSAGDDQEDDVTAFFQSGAYQQQLFLPSIAIVLVVVVVAAVRRLAVKRSAS